MWTISSVLSTLFRQLVKLMRYDSFCFDYQKTPSALATTYKDAMQKHTESIFLGSSLETRLSVNISSEKQGWEKNMLSVNWMDKHWYCISCWCKTICATKLCSCRSQGLSCTDAHIAKARIKERLYQREIVKVTMRKKINTWNHSLRKKVRFQVLKHKMNVKYIELLPLD